MVRSELKSWRPLVMTPVNHKMRTKAPMKVDTGPITFIAVATHTYFFPVLSSPTRDAQMDICIYLSFHKAQNYY